MECLIKILANNLTRKLTNMFPTFMSATPPTKEEKI